MSRATVALPPPLRAILTDAIDYAGLFPPASQRLVDAVADYAAYAAGPEAWALGRFVVPLDRLEQLDQVLPAVPIGSPWRVSALVSASEGDLRRVRAFNEAHDGRATIDAVEAKAPSAAQVEHLAPFVGAGLEVFAEIPVTGDIEPAVAAAGRIGVRGKIRTGGVTPEAFPSSAQIVRFLRACHELGVPFKATAGLHHPLRGTYRLTYEPNAPRSDMYGYVNLVLAAVLLWMGEDEATVTAMLEERDQGALHVDAVAVQWQSHVIETTMITRARHALVRGFGSCSFREPLDEAVDLVVS